MKVYVLMDGCYHEEFPEGVYATLELAQAAHPHTIGWTDALGCRFLSCNAFIVEFDVEGA